MVMDCTQTRDRLSDYQDGALDPAAAEAVSAHLRGCGECAAVSESLDAVRERLRGLPAIPAPGELMPRILAAVEAERSGGNATSGSTPKAPPKAFLSRFRFPLEAAAALLLAASVYWYQRPAPPVSSPSTALSSSSFREPAGASSSGGTAARGEPAGSVRTRGAAPAAGRRSAPATGRPEDRPIAPPPAAAGEKERPQLPPSTGAARTWNMGDLPAAPAVRASSDSERIVPPPPAAESGTTAKGGREAEGPAPEGERRTESAERTDSPWPRVFAAPPSRLFRPLPYGREIRLDIAREEREGAEDRIAAAALRVGGVVERIELDGGQGGGAPGTVRVILPSSAAGGFLDELRRMGTVSPGGMPLSIDIPAGPRPGTVAYAVRIRIP